MFGSLFRPSCPCDSAAKAWVEERLQWLAEEFDDSAFSGRRIVLPTPAFFPDPYDGSEESVRSLLDRVCRYMDAAPDSIDLKFIAKLNKVQLVNGSGFALPGGAAGTYVQKGDRFIVQVDRAGLHDPMGLVGTVAHELAHSRLLGENRIKRTMFDNELLTDLTVVHFGLGIFLANGPRAWISQFTRWPDSDLRKPEYMTAPMFGWALAHLAWFRGEAKPSWAKYLNSSARINLKQGIRYLGETEDSAYRPAGRRRPPCGN